jgi:hypothetical protein
LRVCLPCVAPPPALEALVSLHLPLSGFATSTTKGTMRPGMIPVPSLNTYLAEKREILDNPL